MTFTRIVFPLAATGCALMSLGCSGAAISAGSDVSPSASDPSHRDPRDDRGRRWRVRGRDHHAAEPVAHNNP